MCITTSLFFCLNLVPLSWWRPVQLHWLHCPKAGSDKTFTYSMATEYVSKSRSHLRCTRIIFVTIILNGFIISNVFLVYFEIYFFWVERKRWKVFSIRLPPIKYSRTNISWCCKFLNSKMFLTGSGRNETFSCVIMLNIISMTTGTSSFRWSSTSLSFFPPK